METPWRRGQVHSFTEDLFHFLQAVSIHVDHLDPIKYLDILRLSFKFCEKISISVFPDS